jgi:short-subunit dehydrogenase
VIDINLTGAALSAAAVLPQMQARGRGHVAFIASVAAFRGMPDSPAYCASKAGLRVLAESLRPRLAADGVAVSVVLPGFFESAMTDQWHGDKGEVMPVDLMAAHIMRGLRRRQSRIVVPRRLGLLMQLLDLLPAAIGDRLVLRARFQIDNSGANAAS